MERRVLISHATDDPEWTPDQVEAVALAIQQAGIRVSLDLWHQRDAKRHLSLGEWRDWMDESIDAATHILCLVSTRYRELWSRKRDVHGGFGVAFESIRLIHHLYLLKQHNDGRILTLRPEVSGYDCIPRDLALDCPAYRWGGDRTMLLSHVCEAELRARARSPNVDAGPAQPRLRWASDSGEDTYGQWADLTVNDVTQRMRWIEPSGPAGFWMGEKQAYLSREVVADGFWLADTPCTQAFWQAVTGINPSHFKQGADAQGRPVESVSWDDVMDQFIARFAAMPDWGTGNGLSLPSEMEWEYAARAGRDTAYWWGDQRDDARANWDQQHNGTTPVDRYPPNRWGLYDVHGNVWEWCSDVWRDRRDAPEALPNETLRVVRGGSWINLPGRARAASRLGGPRRYALRSAGFRFVLRSPSGPEARGGGAGR